MASKLAFFLLSVTLFSLFVIFSFLVAKERFTQNDFDTTVKLQDRLSRKWDLPFSLLSLIGSAEITALIWLGLAIIIFIKRYWLTLIALPTFFIALAIEITGKIFIYHPSPPHFMYRGVFDFDLPSRYVVHSNYSYPSGHMLRTSFIATFLIIFFLFKTHGMIRLLIISGLLLFMVTMIVSRIYLGEHWASDVIGGLLLGSSAGIFTGVTIPLKALKQPRLSMLKLTSHPAA